MQKTIAIATLLIMAASIIFAILVIKKPMRRTPVLLIAGQPRTGKTTLFHHLCHDERPPTLKSTQITQFTGYILCNAHTQF